MNNDRIGYLGRLTGDTPPPLENLAAAALENDSRIAAVLELVNVLCERTRSGENAIACAARQIVEDIAAANGGLYEDLEFWKEQIQAPEAGI